MSFFPLGAACSDFAQHLGSVLVVIIVVVVVSCSHSTRCHGSLDVRILVACPNPVN